MFDIFPRRSGGLLDAEPPSQPMAGSSFGSFLNSPAGFEPNYGLMAVGQGIASGDVGGAMKDFAPLMAAGRTKNKTVQWLVSKGMDPEDAEVYASNPQMFNDLMKGKDDPYSQRADAAAQYGLSGDDATSFILTGQLPTGRFGSAEVGLQPIWGQDKDGNYVLMQPSKSGDMVPSVMPEGVKPLSPYDRKYQESSGFAAGKGQGEAVEAWRSMSSKMPGLELVVRQLDDLADRATYTAAGQGLDWTRGQLGMEPREAAVARTSYISMVDNQILPLLRDTFGAQFTQKEGEALRATLGDPNKTPKEKQAVLKAFIQQKRRDVEALAQRTGQQETVPAPDGGGVESMSDDELRAIINGQ